MMKLGFVGTGAITAAMVQGLKRSALADASVLVSPRNATLAATLATLPNVRVAADNQAVVDGADMVFLAIRPQIAEAVVRPLQFRAGQQIVSLVAALQIASLQDWIGAKVHLSRAIPLPFVQQLQGVTPVFPPNPAVEAVFAALGQCIAVKTLAEYDVYGAASAMMASYFGLLQNCVAWMTEQNLPEPEASAYMRSLFSNLGQTALLQPDLSLEHLREAHSTRGGLNEFVHDSVAAAGGFATFDHALSLVLQKIRLAATQPL